VENVGKYVFHSPFLLKTSHASTSLKIKMADPRWRT